MHAIAHSETGAAAMPPKLTQRVNVAWTTFGDDVIRRYYPEGGTKACQRWMPNRTAHSITWRAMSIGVKRNREGGVDGVPPTQDFSGSPVQVYADDHRAWQQIDRTIRGVPVGVLAPRLAA